MKIRSSSQLVGLALGVAGALACLAQGPEPELKIKDLPDEQLSAGLVVDDLLSLPSPPELLLVLAKEGSPKWRKLYYPTLKGQESDRTKIALRFGLSITEGHLASMARDAQKIRDVTNDLQRYANVLGIGDGLAERARSINGLADAKAWRSVAYELEALVAKTSEILVTQRDNDLADLVSTGLWIRLLEISTSVVNEEDFADTTIAISSHHTLRQIIAPHSEANNPTVKSLRDQLAKLERIWNPEKLLHGHKFDDELIQDSHRRLTHMLNIFARRT